MVKNQPAYYHQARVEIGVLQFLNTRADPGDAHHLVRLKVGAGRGWAQELGGRGGVGDGGGGWQPLTWAPSPHLRAQDFFLYRNHLCLAFELLSLNLYELIRHNKFRGLSLSLVRVFISQILDAMAVLRDSRIIHCDLKPENVLLKNVESGAGVGVWVGVVGARMGAGAPVYGLPGAPSSTRPHHPPIRPPTAPGAGEVKVIDFGSACFENRTVYSYIQSRFYRSPEVGRLGLGWMLAGSTAGWMESWMGCCWARSLLSSLCGCRTGSRPCCTHASACRLPDLLPARLLQVVLGYPYAMSIDVWSLGCVAAELYLGLPLFPGACELDLLSRIIRWDCAALCATCWPSGRSSSCFQGSLHLRQVHPPTRKRSPLNVVCTRPPPLPVQHAGPAARVLAVPGQERGQVLLSAGGGAAGPGWLGAG